MKKIRLLLAEDHLVVREGLRALLSSEPEFDVVAEATDGFEAVRLAQEHEPQVVIMDVGLPGLSGVDAAKRIKRELPLVKIVMLSMHDDGPTVQRASKAGATGYVLKGDGIGTIKQAVRTVVAGGSYTSPGLFEPVASESSTALTDREREILKLVAEGLTGRQIAQLLYISAKTVENHRGRIMAKLGIHSTAGLVRYALKEGLTE